MYACQTYQQSATSVSSDNVRNKCTSITWCSKLNKARRRKQMSKTLDTTANYQEPDKCITYSKNNLWQRHANSCLVVTFLKCLSCSPFLFYIWKLLLQIPVVRTHTHTLNETATHATEEQACCPKWVPDSSLPVDDMFVFIASKHFYHIGLHYVHQCSMNKIGSLYFPPSKSSWLCSHDNTVPKAPAELALSCTTM